MLLYESGCTVLQILFGFTTLSCCMLVYLRLTGFETTAHSLSWTLALLAAHPEAEAVVVEELRSRGLLATPEQ